MTNYSSKVEPPAPRPRMNEYFLPCLQHKKPWPAKLRMKLQQYYMNGEWKDLIPFEVMYLQKIDDTHVSWKVKKPQALTLKSRARVRVVIVDMRGKVVKVNEMFYAAKENDSITFAEYRVTFE